MEKNNRLLIIDDDVRILRAYRDILSPKPKPDVLSEGALLFGTPPKETPQTEQTRYELTLAKNGEMGVRRVKKADPRRKPFAAAFIDMKMPGIDGAETAKRIWRIDPKIKILIATAYSKYLPDDISRVTGRSDFFFLRKPFNPEEIRQFAKVFVSLWNEERHKERKRRGGQTAPRIRAGGGVNRGPQNVPAISSSKPAHGGSDSVYGQPGIYSVDQGDPQHAFAECPFCKHGIGFRIPRKNWMRLIPYSKFYLCNWCFRTFMKSGK